MARVILVAAAGGLEVNRFVVRNLDNQVIVASAAGVNVVGGRLTVERRANPERVAAGAASNQRVGAWPEDVFWDPPTIVPPRLSDKWPVTGPSATRLAI